MSMASRTSKLIGSLVVMVATATDERLRSEIGGVRFLPSRWRYRRLRAQGHPTSNHGCWRTISQVVDNRQCSNKPVEAVQSGATARRSTATV